MALEGILTGTRLRALLLQSTDKPWHMHSDGQIAFKIDLVLLSFLRFIFTCLLITDDFKGISILFS